MTITFPPTTVRARRRTGSVSRGGGLTTDAVVMYPRAFAALSISVEGRTVNTGIVPSRASVTRRSHNQAGTCEITILGSALPFDPRQVDGIYVELLLGAGPSIDADIRQDRGRYRQFTGYVDEMKPSWSENGLAVDLKARDLSALFRDFKPLPREALPRYSDTVAEAIERIILAVPATGENHAHIELGIPLGLRSVSLSAAHRSRAARAFVPLPQDATAWQAIEHICGLGSLLVSMDLNEIVVRAPSQSFGHEAEPVATFTFGSDAGTVFSVEQERKFVRNRRGVKVTSYDPITRQQLEAVYPPDSEARIHRPGRRGGGNGDVERDVFPAPIGMISPDGLAAYAQRIYDERSRQEIEGKLVTPVWTDDVLALRNGDRVTIRIHPQLEAELRNTTDRNAAVDLLVDRLDVDREAAAALLDSSRNRRTNPWYVRSVTHEFEADPISAQTTVEFINLIRVQQ